MQMTVALATERRNTPFCAHKGLWNRPKKQQCGYIFWNVITWKFLAQTWYRSGQYCYTSCTIAMEVLMTRQCLQTCDDSKSLLICRNTCGIRIVRGGWKPDCNGDQLALSLSSCRIWICKALQSPFLPSTHLYIQHLPCRHQTSAKVLVLCMIKNKAAIKNSSGQLTGSVCYV